MRSDPFLSSILPGFRDYIDNRNHLQSNNPQRRSEAEIAVTTIEDEGIQTIREKKAKGDLIESMSLTIRDMLYEAEQAQLFSEGVLSQPTPGTTTASIDHRWLSENSVTDSLYTGGNGSWGRLHSQGFSGMAEGIRASDQRNDGEKFEDGMVYYAKELGITLKRLGQPGLDLQLIEQGGQGRTYELKKSIENKPNLLLNSTFPKPNADHYYIFVVNLPKFGGKDGVLAAWQELEAEVGDGQLGPAFDAIELDVGKRRSINKGLDYFHRSGSGTAARSEVVRWINSGDGETEGDSESVKIFQQLVSEIMDVFKKTEEEVYSSLFNDKGAFTTDSIKGFRRTARGLYKQHPRSGSSQGEIGAKFKRLLGDVKMWVVPSRVLRLELLRSAFPSGIGILFDNETGELLPGGKSIMAADIKAALETLKIEEKIVDKISPIVEKQIVDGNANNTEEVGFSFRLNLLKIRIKIAIEPESSVGEIET